MEHPGTIFWRLHCSQLPINGAAGMTVGCSDADMAVSFPWSCSDVLVDGMQKNRLLLGHSWHDGVLEKVLGPIMA